ncbi:unnamed protein product, partial [Didymodactylos carnosus]
YLLTVDLEQTIEEQFLNLFSQTQNILLKSTEKMSQTSEICSKMQMIRNDFQLLEQDYHQLDNEPLIFDNEYLTKQLQLITQLNNKFPYYEQELRAILVDQMDNVDVLESMLNDLFKQYDILR